MDYIAKVIIYNLLPWDYRKTQLEKIEDAIRSTIFSAAEGVGVKGEIFFSFPRDPSAKTSAVSVGVDVRPYFKSKDMARPIRNALFSLFEETRHFFVEVHGFGGSTKK